MNRILDSLIWLGLLAIAYFASDIIDRGKTLNELLPYPILGTAMWCAIVLVVWLWLVYPVLQFFRLKTLAKDSRSLEKQADGILKELNNDRNPDQTTREWITRISAARHGCYSSTASDQEKYQSAMKSAVGEYLRQSATGRSGKVNDTISRHCLAAACAVAVSRNNFLDGVSLLLIQSRMVIQMARIYGYKPSPVFNALCLTWILSNSLLITLLKTDDFARVGAELFSELIFDPEDLTEDTLSSLTQKIAANVMEIFIQGVIAGGSVYITGKLFQRRLEGDARKLSMEDYLQLRREGKHMMRKELASTFSSTIKQLPKSVANMFKNLFSKDSASIPS